MPPTKSINVNELIFDDVQTGFIPKPLIREVLNRSEIWPDPRKARRRSNLFSILMWDENVVAIHKGFFVIRNPQDKKREIYIVRDKLARSPFQMGIAFYSVEKAIKSIDELPKQPTSP